MRILFVVSQRWNKRKWVGGVRLTLAGCFLISLISRDDFSFWIWAEGKMREGKKKKVIMKKKKKKKKKPELATP